MHAVGKGYGQHQTIIASLRAWTNYEALGAQRAMLKGSRLRWRPRSDDTRGHLAFFGVGGEGACMCACKWPCRAESRGQLADVC
jgi:hypothetical protein